MVKVFLTFLLSIVCFLGIQSFAQEKLIYHDVKVDARGGIVPWFSEDLGASYDHVINAVWNFWDTIRADTNGQPYYMNHQVWRPDFNDPRGIGGDQIAMAMSSWQLLYAYTGNERIKQNIKYMADYYLTHGLSPESCAWPNLPFPYNTLIYSGFYDGDMVMGKGYLQPDKAGSFGLELIRLYEMSLRDNFFHSNADRYFAAAKQIAHTLLAHMTEGTETASPLPFRVNAFTGDVGQYPIHSPDGDSIATQDYTANWAPTMELFLELEKVDGANGAHYRRGFDILLNWMKKYPLKNNKWGPFFEDVPGAADTQINAGTFALFILTHREYFTHWRTDVPKIFKWTYAILGNDSWQKYGVTVVNEQTSNQEPGQSHVARQGAIEVLYSALSGDRTYLTNAIRQLNWATYMVDEDGKNRFPKDENWLTDGYGDYVRHYLRAMAAMPELAPSDTDHLLSSTSVIQQADYKGQINKFLVPYVKADDLDKVRVFYRAFDESGVEVIRAMKRPTLILLDGNPLSEWAGGFRWTPLKVGGILQITRNAGTEVVVLE